MADDAQLQNMLHELGAWKVVHKKHRNKKSSTCGQHVNRKNTRRVYKKADGSRPY